MIQPHTGSTSLALKQYHVWQKVRGDAQRIVNTEVHDSGGMQDTVALAPCLQQPRMRRLTG